MFFGDGVYLDIAGDRVILEGKNQGQQLIIPGSTKASPPTGGEITAIDTSGMIRAQSGVYLDLVNQKVENFYEEPTEYEMAQDLARAERNIRIANEPKDFLGRSLYASINLQEGLKEGAKGLGMGLYETGKSIAKTGVYYGQSTSVFFGGTKEINSALNIKPIEITQEDIKTTLVTGAITAGLLIPVLDVAIAGYYGTKLAIGSGEKFYSGYTSPDLQSKYRSYGQGLFTGALAAGTFYMGSTTKTGRYVKDIWRTRGMKELKLETFTTKPFIKTEGGIKRLVFMKRAEKFSILKPSSYKYLGNKPGEFYQREYRLASPKVISGEEGLSQVTYYKLTKGNKIKLVTEATSTFPTSAKALQPGYFKTRQIQEYYLPGATKSAKGMKLGYSATSEKWTDNVISSELPEYVSGKGISTRFLRIGDKYTLIGTGLETGGSPTVYAEYAKRVKVNPAKYEARIKNPFGGTKPVKKYVFSKPIEEGAFELPLYKPEVEANIFGTRQPFGKGYSFSYKGRIIGVQQSTIAEGVTASTSGGVPTVGYSSSYVSSSATPIFTPSKLSLVAKSSKTSSKLSSVSSAYSIVSSKPMPSLISTPSYSSSSKISRVSTPSYSRGSSYKSAISSSVVSMPSSIVSSASSISRPSKAYPSLFTPTSRNKPNLKITTVKMPSKFLVEVRRFGKFKPIGVFGSMRQAFSVGRGKVSRTLAATFRVKGPGALRTPKGFYSKITPQGRLFIQQPKFRLSTRTERGEIQMFGRQSKRRKRR